ncbi:MAG: hypothetical protein FD130_1907 [Halothiobacillaceae bacterium]|nr:MAG: hypothetical protein FD130_1907 [Halothiobacillaceae bacterium]
MFGRAGFAALHFDVEHHAQVAYPVGMQGVTGAPWFDRVATHFGTCLMAVQQLDGGVSIKYPEGIQSLAGTLTQRGVHLGCTFGELCCANG